MERETNNLEYKEGKTTSFFKDSVRFCELL